MAINDVAGETVYCVWDIPREILCHNFVSDLHTLRPKKLKTFLNLFFPARICTIQHGCFCESDDLLTTLQKSMSGWTWKIHLVIWSILSLNFIDSKSTFFMQSWHLVLLCPSFKIAVCWKSKSNLLCTDDCPMFLPNFVQFGPAQLGQDCINFHF